MMFTIAPVRLIRMVEAADAASPVEPRGRSVVYLRASCGRVSVGRNGRWFEDNSMIWDEGQCRMLSSELLSAMRQFRLEPTITAEVKYGQLRIRHAIVPVLGSCSWTAVSETQQSDFATD